MFPILKKNITPEQSVFLKLLLFQKVQQIMTKMSKGGLVSPGF